MTVKTTGAEFKKFYEDQNLWPEDVWHEEARLFVDDVEQVDGGIDINNLSDSATVTIEGGVLLGVLWEDGDGPSLETYFLRWKKLQSTVCFNVECDKSIVDAVKAAIRAAGGKVS